MKKTLCFLGFFLATILLLVVLQSKPTPQIQIAQTPTQEIKPNLPPRPPRKAENPLIAAHNAIRVSHKLPPLKQDPELMAMAQKWADHMAKTHIMRHQTLKLLGGWRGMGENIAEGQRSIDEVMKAWMKSPGHRANILRKGYTHIGVGMAQASNGTYFWCVDFGTKP